MKGVKLDSKNSAISDLVQQELDSLGIDLKKLGYSDVSHFAAIVLEKLFDDVAGSIVQGNKKQLLRVMMEELIQKEGIISPGTGFISHEIGSHKFKINVVKNDGHSHNFILRPILHKLIKCLPLESLSQSEDRVSKSQLYESLVDSCNHNLIVTNYVVENDCYKYELIKELGLEDIESYQMTATHLVIVAELIRKKFYKKLYKNLNNYYSNKGETNTIRYNYHTGVCCIFLIKHQSLFDKYIMIEYRGGGYGYDSFYEVGVDRVIGKGAQLILVEEEITVKDL